MGRAVYRTEIVVHPLVLAAGLGSPASPQQADSLYLACGRTQNPGIACRLVWDMTHSTKAAELTTVYFAGPVQLAIRIGYVLLIAVVLRLIAHRAIGRITSRATRNGGDATDRTHALLFRARRQQRAAALGAILSNAASLTIFGIAVVIIIGDMGLNLAPVLASAGVLGVAIGFGAQNLVQDFLAGIFMLLEDQYGVGDVISVGHTTGTVEGVSLRITRLRDVNGVVWHVRNGTIKKAGNESQGWARAVVDFPIPYHHDLPEVRQTMMRTADAMWQDPAWHEIILEEPEVWGVQELSSDGVLMRVTARTPPLRQWEVQRELTERLKLALDAAGAINGTSPGSGSGAVVPAQAPPDPGTR
jgi:moderate conductance mechanosensitive channel